MPRGINAYDEGRLQGRNIANANSSNIVSPGIVTDGLVLHVDAGNYQSYPIAGTTWYDLSGYRNNGTLTNGPTYARVGGGAIDFDGSDDYINVAAGLLLNRPFSINTWVFFDLLTGWRSLAGQDSTAAVVPSFLWHKTPPTGGGAGRLGDCVGLTFVNSSAVEIYAFDTTAVATSTWYNYCVSVSTTDIKLYKNGVLITTTTNSDSMATPTGNIIIGMIYYNHTRFDSLDGKIPVNSFYNRALTPTEVAQNFNALRARFGV